MSRLASNNMVLDVLLRAMIEIRYGHGRGNAPETRGPLFSTLLAASEVCGCMGDRDLVGEARHFLKDALVVLDAAAVCAQSDIQSESVEGGVA